MFLMRHCIYNRSSVEKGTVRILLLFLLTVTVEQVTGFWYDVRQLTPHISSLLTSEVDRGVGEREIYMYKQKFCEYSAQLALALHMLTC